MWGHSFCAITLNPPTFNGDSRRRFRPSRLDAALLVQGQLLPEKQVLEGHERRRRDITPGCVRADLINLLCQSDTCRASSRWTGCSICGAQGPRTRSRPSDGARHEPINMIKLEEELQKAGMALGIYRRTPEEVG
jgi:hypothetical protein